MKWHRTYAEIKMVSELGEDNALKENKGDLRLCGRSQAIPPQHVIAWEDSGLFCALTFRMNKSSQINIRKEAKEL